MGNHDDCQVLLLLLDVDDGVLDLSLTFGVKCAGSLIKYKDLWVLDQGTSDSNTLLLPS